MSIDVSKYKVAPGLWIGSEIGDLNRELKKEMKLYLDGDETALRRATKICRKKEELMKPERLRKNK
jgi:hypothetical protein